MTDSRTICEVSALDDPGSRAFQISSGDWPLRAFVVRNGEQVRAYVNRCPHAGHPLNARPDEFLTNDHSLIMCRSHGALFETMTGTCVAGPCVGRDLLKIEVNVVDGYVLLTDDPGVLAARFG